MNFRILNLLFLGIFSHVTLYAVDVTTSVPLPPNAWTVAGADAGGATESGNADFARVRWGPSGSRSWLEFDAEGEVAGLPPTTPVIFRIGKLKYFNNSSPTAGLDSADLSLIFDVENGGDSDLINLDINFTLTGFGDSRVVFVGQTNTSVQPILVDGVEYSIAILGFSSDRGTTFFDSFKVKTYKKKSHKLYAALYAQESTVPEPGTYLILGSLLGVGALARRRGLNLEEQSKQKIKINS